MTTQEINDCLDLEVLNERKNFLYEEKSLLYKNRNIAFKLVDAELNQIVKRIEKVKGLLIFETARPKTICFGCFIANCKGISYISIEDKYGVVEVICPYYKMFPNRFKLE